MNPSLLIKRFAPHIASVLVFLAAALLFLKPIAFDGKSFPELDNTRARGMQVEWKQYKKETGEHILWTQSAFAGMPTYQIQPYTQSTLISYWGYIATFGHSIMEAPFMLFLMMFSFYLTMLILQMDWKISLLGSLAYGFLTYHLLLLEAGHSTKIFSISFVAPMLASALAVFRGRLLIGGLTFLFFSAGQFYANHMQITYYTVMLLGILGAVELVYAVREKRMKMYVLSCVVMFTGLVIGFLGNVAQAWSTYEYAHESIRGKSELKRTKHNQNGLDESYVFEYSPSISETFTMIVPGFAGGSSKESFASDVNSQSLQTAKKLTLAITKENQAQVSSLMSHYWGGKPHTSGPVYYGAAICLLFVLGMVLGQPVVRWWAGIGFGVFVCLSWGQHFSMVNMFMFKHFPFYDKFRDVSTTLNVLEALFYIVAMIGLWEYLKAEKSAAERQRALKIALGVTGGICLLLLCWTFVGEASGANDQKLVSLGLKELLRPLHQDRAAMIRLDIFRTLGILVLTAGTLYAFNIQKLNSTVALVGIGAIAITDMVSVDSRFITQASFFEKMDMAAIPQPTPADRMVFQDQTLHYRVLDLLRGHPMTSSQGCYFHKTIGGYHAAKLRRYQELVDRYIMDPKGKLTFEQNLNVLGMLNTKYILRRADSATLNPFAMGNAWFVDSVRVVNSADEELEAIGMVNLRKYTVFQKEYAPKDLVNGRPIGQDSIWLASYHPERMKYEYHAESPRVAVFSEMYYPPSKGWNTYLDGELLPEGFGKANYLLRYLSLPAGKHTIEMRYEPQSILLGQKISFVSSLLAWVALLVALYLGVRQELTQKRVV